MKEVVINRRKVVGDLPRGAHPYTTKGISDDSDSLMVIVFDAEIPEGGGGANSYLRKGSFKTMAGIGQDTLADEVVPIGGGAKFKVRKGQMWQHVEGELKTSYRLKRTR